MLHELDVQKLEAEMMCPQGMKVGKKYPRVPKLEERAVEVEAEMMCPQGMEVGKKYPWVPKLEERAVEVEVADPAPKIGGQSFAHKTVSRSWYANIC
jgi:hypothetical protein